jgi:hypothetical protein
MRFSVSALVTYRVLPPARRDDGIIVPDDHGAIECANAEAAALELMIEHCNVLLANGPADSFSARRQSAKTILQKLKSARS